MKNPLKKTLTALLVTVLTVSLAVPVFAADAAEELAEDETYYHIVSMSDGEQEYTGDILTALGMEAYMILKDDGTGVLSFDGDEEEITWTENAIINGGVEAPITREGDNIRVEADGMSIEFAPGKADAAAAAILTPAPFDPDTRAGYYKLATMDNDGEVINASILEMMGMQVFLVLNEDNSGQLVLFGMGMELTWDDDVFTIESESSPYTYDEGSISLEAEGSALTFVYAGTPDEAPEVENVDVSELENLDLSDLGLN